jgi:predicted ester cyclase
VETERAELMDFYRRYLECCNDRRFDELDEFVDEDVRINDTPQGRDQYIAGIRAAVEAFPDFYWDLQHLLVDGNWLSARLIDTGTHTGTFLDVPATGRTITAQEFSMYRVSSGKIVENWGDLGSSVRDQLTGGAAG